MTLGFISGHTAQNWKSPESKFSSPVPRDCLPQNKSSTSICHLFSDWRSSENSFPKLQCARKHLVCVCGGEGSFQNQTPSSVGQGGSSWPSEHCRGAGPGAERVLCCSFCGEQRWRCGAVTSEVSRDWISLGSSTACRLK